MKLISLLFIFISIIPMDRGSIPWVLTYPEGETLSQKENKLIMMYFWSPNSESCRRMDIETMTRESVVTLATSYVPILVNFEDDNDIVGRYQVQSIPQIVIVDSYGVEIDRLKGLRTNYKNSDATGGTRRGYQSALKIENLEAITPTKLERFLGKYPSDISLINNAQKILAKDQEDLNAIFGIAEAYLLTSVDATDSGIANLIAESSTYLGIAKKILKKKSNKVHQQRYDILNLAKGLFTEKPTKGLKKMLDFKKSNKIQPENVAITSASLYIAYNRLKQKSKANAQIELLKSAAGGEMFVDFLNLAPSSE